MLDRKLGAHYLSSSFFTFCISKLLSDKFLFSLRFFSLAYNVLNSINLLEANSVLLLSSENVPMLLNISFNEYYLINGGSDRKESAWNAENQDSIPGSGRSPGKWNSYPLQYSCLENSMDREPGGLPFMGLQMWLSH